MEISQEKIDVFFEKIDQEKFKNTNELREFIEEYWEDTIPNFNNIKSSKGATLENTNIAQDQIMHAAIKEFGAIYNRLFDGTNEVDQLGVDKKSPAAVAAMTKVALSLALADENLEPRR